MGGENDTSAQVALGTADAERRQLTVLFCDLVDSVQLSTRIDEEDLHNLLGRYQEVCGRIVDAHAGHIGQLRGDGVFANFGYPEARENSAELAVLAALEIVDAVPSITETHSLSVRVGIATGPVVVGGLEPHSPPDPVGPLG